MAPSAFRRWFALVAAAFLCSLPAFAGAAVPPIRLADPTRIPFAGKSLVVADLDGTSGLDLVGVDGTDVVAVLNDGNGGFGATLTFPMGAAALSVLRVADLDGDGRNDLIAMSSAARSVTVRRQGAGLVFGPSEISALPGRPQRGLALGDFNGDGRPDVAEVCQDSQCVAILINDGAGHLGAAIRLNVTGALSAPMAEDFNGDGFVDVGLGVSAPVPRLFLLAGNGDGTFDPPLAVSPPGTSGFVHPVAGDLDGDGDLDIAANDETDLSIVPNLGNGTFGARQILASPRSDTDPFIGDLDRDGRPDIALTDGDTWFGPLGFLMAFHNRGALSFGPAMRYGIGPLPGSAVLADLDGDSWLEGIAACNRMTDGNCNDSGPPGAFVLHNAGTGALDGMFEVPDPVWLPVRSGSGELPDLVGSSPAGVMYRAENLGNGTFDPAEAVGWGTPIAVQDLDGDGDEDLVVTSDDSTWVLPNLGAAGFGAPSFTVVGVAFRDFADFSGDGKLDMLVTESNSELAVCVGDGACGFAAPIHYGSSVPVAQDADDVRGKDLNGDGYGDVLYVTTEKLPNGGAGYHYVTKLFTLLNDQTGGFGGPDSSVLSIDYDNAHPKTHGPGILRLGDWTGDGKTDAIHLTGACTTDNAATEAVFLGAGDGTFSGVGPPSPSGKSWCDARAGDLNGDGLDDLLKLDSTSGCTYHAIASASDGAGDFPDPGHYPMGVQPFEGHLADLDGDGRLDVVTLNRKFGPTSTYSIRRNVTPAGGPTPALVSLVSSSVEDGVVHLDWFAAEAGFTGTVERRTVASAWTAIGSRSSDGTGHLRYDDPEVVPGESYGYRLRIEAGELVSGESWVTVPGGALALRGVWPNPANEHPAVALSLPASGSVDVAVFDIGGRLVHRESHERLGAGNHRLVLGGTSFAPGIYVARLSFAGRTQRTRFVVVR